MAMSIHVGGDPIMVEHTPTTDVAIGDVVITNSTVRIAKHAIPANTLGALAAIGDVVSVAGDAVIAADVKVYWNPAVSQVTATAGALKVFGVTVTACSGAAALCNVRHDPGA